MNLRLPAILLTTALGAASAFALTEAATPSPISHRRPAAVGPRSE